MKRKQWLLVAMVAMLVLFSGAPYQTKAEESGKDKIKRASGWGNVIDDADTQSKKDGSMQVSATQSIAENERFQLFVDEKAAQVRIVDKTTGKEWLGAPQVDNKVPPNNRKFVQSPVHIRYTEGVSTTQTYPSKEKNSKITMKPIDDGVRFTYDLPSLKISFALEYKLADSGFEATVPFGSIKETGSARLTSLELLPFFGAANDNEQGAIFVPDGSGALIRFKQSHPQYFDGYSEFVYGGDPTYLKKVNEEVDSWIARTTNPKESIALPVFGIYNEQQGFLAVISKGEHDAKINATPSGIRNINMYRASAEFIYRNDDVIFIGNSGEIPLYQGNMVKGDRTVKYILLSGEQANYVGMAHAYRDYLIKDKGLKPNPQTKIPFQLRLFGGVLRDEIIGSTFVKMTTFDQAKKIIDAFTAKGIDAMEITYEGWSDDGEFGNEPNHFPAEGKLGGTKDLKDLAAYAKAKGISLYLQANYVRPYSDSDDVWAYRDAVRGLDRDILRVNNYFVSTRFSKFREKFYLLKPDRVFDRYIADEADEFAGLGMTGVHLKYMGDMLYSDQDSKHLTDRSHTAGVWVKALDLMRKKTGKTSVDYGFAYTLGHVDRIDDIPLDSSHFTYENEQVPFYQIAIHGLIPYTAEPSNLRDDPRVGLLKTLEYGAVPSYEMTYRPTSDLQRTMMDRLFSSYYKTLMQPSISEYREVSALLNKVADQPIVNHEKLGPRLFKTTYGNGVQIIVNYDDQSAYADNESIKAFGYVVKEGRK